MSFRPTRDRRLRFACRDRRLAIERCEDRVVLSAAAEVPTLRVDGGAFLYTLADSFVLFDSDGNSPGVIVQADAVFAREVKSSLSLAWSNGSLDLNPSSLSDDINLNSEYSFKTILAPGASSDPEKGWIPLPVVQPGRNLPPEGPPGANGSETTVSTVQSSDMRDEGLALPPSEIERPRSKAVFFEVAATYTRPASVASAVDAADKSASTEQKREDRSAGSPTDTPKARTPRDVAATLADEVLASDETSTSYLDLTATLSKLPNEAASQPTPQKGHFPTAAAEHPLASPPNIDPKHAAFAVRDDHQMDEVAAPITHRHYPEALAVALAALAGAEHHLSTRRSQRIDRKETKLSALKRTL